MSWVNEILRVTKGCDREGTSSPPLRDSFVFISRRREKRERLHVRVLKRERSSTVLGRSRTRHRRAGSRASPETGAVRFSLSGTHKRERPYVFE
eukprot:1194699-Prorocentrum_minimum.AAC.2